MRLIEPDDVLSHTPRGTYRPTLPSPDSKRSNCFRNWACSDGSLDHKTVTEQVKWSMISKVKYFLETFPVFWSYVLTLSIWKWMFITGAPYIFPCLLLSTLCCDIKASIQPSHFFPFHCLSVKLCNALVAKNYLMITACGQRFKIISFVSFTGPKSKAYCWRGMSVNL